MRRWGYGRWSSVSYHLSAGQHRHITHVAALLPPDIAESFRTRVGATLKINKRQDRSVTDEIVERAIRRALDHLGLEEVEA